MVFWKKYGAINEPKDAENSKTADKKKEEEDKNQEQKGEQSSKDESGSKEQDAAKDSDKEEKSGAEDSSDKEKDDTGKEKDENEGGEDNKAYEKDEEEEADDKEVKPDEEGIEEAPKKERAADEPFEFDPDFNGPIKNRSCTDVICLLLFLVFMAGWGVLAGFAYYNGNPERLIFPTDTAGRMCGKSRGVEKRPALLFYNIAKCASPTVLLTGCPTPQVCVEKCPNKTFTVYQTGFPGIYNRTALKSKIGPYCKHGVNVNAYPVKQLLEKEMCPSWYLESVNLGGRCIPPVQKLLNTLPKDIQNSTDGIDIPTLKKASKYLGILMSTRQIVEKIFQDFAESWELILVGLFVSMIISLIWIILMRFIAGIMVWCSMLAVTVLLSFSCYYCYRRYEKIKSVSGSGKNQFDIKFTTNIHSYSNQSGTWLFLLILSAVGLAIILLMLIFLRNRIRIAIALIEQGSRAVGSMMYSLFFPLIPWILQLIVIGFYMAVAVHLASAGKPIYVISGYTENGCTCGSHLNYTTNGTCNPVQFNKTCGTECEKAECLFFKFVKNPNILRYHLYNTFVFFWAIFFVTALGEMVLAGAFAAWYWTFNKDKDLPSFVIIGSFRRTLRYHTGTLAFGSLIIAIVRMIRLGLEYVDQKLKKYDNQFVRAIMCVCKCCMYCLEKFLKFLNRNAYIMCAVYGKNFCVSAKNAFFLIMRNIVRVVVIDKVTDFLLFIGKLVVVGGVGVASFYIFSGRISYVADKIPTLNYYLVPVVTITIGSFFIASSFFGVYSMAVDTLFLCFLEDSERNDGTPEKPYYMSKDLMKILGKKNKFQEPE